MTYKRRREEVKWDSFKFAHDTQQIWRKNINYTIHPIITNI